jgi:hypothetical protein
MLRALFSKNASLSLWTRPDAEATSRSTELKKSRPRPSTALARQVSRCRLSEERHHDSRDIAKAYTPTECPENS